MIDLDAYNRDGFIVMRAPEVATFKQKLSAGLAACALAAIAKEPAFERDVDALRGRTIGEIVDHVVARETANAVSGALYRVFAAAPEIVASVADPMILGWVRGLGVAIPVAGTIPTVRLDRPRDEWHRTAAHQDWWFSLLSPNGVTVWLTIAPLTVEMGYLEVVAGSHRAGEISFRHNPNSGNPYRPAEDWPDSAFTPIPVGLDEILFFSQYLIHRSGFNRSSHTRVTLQLRYNDIATMKHADSSFVVKHSDHVLREQERLLVKT